LSRSQKLFPGFFSPSLLAISVSYALAYDVVLSLTTYEYIRSITVYTGLRPYLSIAYNYGLALIISLMLSLFLLFVANMACKRSPISASSILVQAIKLSSPVFTVSAPMIILAALGLLGLDAHAPLIRIHYVFSLILVIIALLYLELLSPWLAPCLLCCTGLRRRRCLRNCLAASKPILLWIVIALITSTVIGLAISKTLALLSPGLRRPLVGLEHLLPQRNPGWRTRITPLQNTMPRYANLIADPVATLLYASIYLLGVNEAIPARLLEHVAKK